MIFLGEHSKKPKMRKIKTKRMLQIILLEIRRRSDKSGIDFAVTHAFPEWKWSLYDSCHLNRLTRLYAIGYRDPFGFVELSEELLLAGIAPLWY